MWMWELISLNILPILIVAYTTIQTPVTIKSKSDFSQKKNQDQILWRESGV